MNLLIYITCIVLCAQMWRMGGDGQSLWRNPGVAIVIAGLKLLLLCLHGWSWWNLLVLLYIPALWGMLQAFSYGISAPIHKLWAWIFGKGEHGDYWPVELATRATCGFLWAIPAVIFAYFTGNWWLFAAYSIFLTISNGLIGAFVKDVEVSERAVGACVSTSIFV